MGVSITATYIGNKKIRLTHGPSKVEIITSAPLDNEGDGSSFSPTDLFASSLLSCMLTLISIFADRNQIDLSGMHADVEKNMNNDPRRVASLPIKIYLPRSILEKDRAKLERAALSCPVHLSVHPEIAVPVRFFYDV